MRYDQIFRDIAANIAVNYAGSDEKTAQNEPLFYSVGLQQMQKQGKLDDLSFFRMIHQYLISLGDRNLRFRMEPSAGYQPFTNGFTVRSFKGRLYVTSANEEKRLKPGDEILAIDRQLPAVIKKNFQKNLLGSEVEERELWGPILKMSSQITVKHLDGTDANMYLKKYLLSDKLPKLGGHLIGKDILYLNLPHFADSQAMKKLLASKEKSLGRCKKLILDLRHNIGGSESVFVPLLDYLFDEPVLLKDLYDEKGVYSNYTKDNCNRKISMLEQYLPQADEDTSAVITDMTADYREKSGKGLIWEDDLELLEDDTMIGGKGCFEQVILLTDTYCEFSGETFVQLARKSPKVTVIGRPTMGNIDYCNTISIRYDGRFLFSYPMSKTAAAKEGRGVNGKGIAPDRYVPFSPLECVRDVMLEKAVSFHK